MIEIGREYKFIAIVENFNQGEDWANVNVLLDDHTTRYNIKLTCDQIGIFEIGKIYCFQVQGKMFKERIGMYLIKAEDIYQSIQDKTELEEALNKFYRYAPLNAAEAEMLVNKYIALIKNETIHKLTVAIFEKNKREFYIYPAATRFHHAYIGGLAYHTTTMLKVAEGLIGVYPYLSADLVYAGIILHDICKINELETPENPSYTVDGQLLGHLTMGVLEIERMALKLGLQDKEEVKLLQHIVLSSHGLPQFGSAKKPMIGEALLIWYIDTMDSKFTVLQEELANTDQGFTEGIAVLDKMRFYKHHF